MKADNTPLSSEQALDEYFSSLLGLEEAHDESMLYQVNSGIEQQAETPTADDSNDVDDDLNSASLEPELEAEADLVTSEPCYHTLQQEEPYLAQAQLVNTQPLAEAELAEIDQLPNLENLERLFSGLQAQVDSEVDTIDAYAQADVATLEPPLISESCTALAAEQEIQDWDEQFESQVEYQDTIFEASSCVDTKAEADIKAELESVDTELNSADSKPEELVKPDLHGGGDGVKIWQNGERDQSFQVLYFDVNGVTFAVPLDQLGGIHKLSTLSHLIGRPDWYLGLQTNREDQLDVVDTAMWAMPDVLTDEEYKQAYEYVVMLGESQWGLASTALKGTEMLTPDKVRWRETAGKRPWLAGMVKEQMCALVHVSELIDMLNAGLDVKSVQ